MKRLGLETCAMSGTSEEIDEVIGSVWSLVGKVALAVTVALLITTLSSSALMG